MHPFAHAPRARARGELMRRWVEQGGIEGGNPAPLRGLLTLTGGARSDNSAAGHAPEAA